MKQVLSRLIPASLRRNHTVIPVVRLHGTIMSGGGMMRQNLSLARVAATLEKAFETKAPAVAISINSPGGSPVQSRLIYQRIRDLATENKKTVHVFVEDVAASGGYMIAVAGDDIIADPSSIIGSIGVVSAGFGFQDLIAKIGIERRVHTSGNNKAILDSFRPERQEDVEHLKSLQSDIHQVFIDLVKQRRGNKLSETEDLFNGLFWVGEKSRQLGLIDSIGDMRSYLKARYGEKTRLRLMSEPRGFFARKLPQFGSHLSPANSEAIAASAATGLIEALENQSLWRKYNL